MSTAIVNFGIIGTGGRGMHFARGLLARPQDARIVALCDTNAKRLAGAQELLGTDATLYRDYRDLLAREDIAAVIITTPDYTHEEIAQASFRAGKHTLCEKPLATTVEGCRRILQAQAASGKLLEVGFVLRYVTLFERARDIVQRGELGTPRLIELSDHYRGGSSYFRRWNRLSRYSGGLLIHKGTHDFDLLNWILGRLPTHVAAFADVNVFVPDSAKGERCLTCANRCPDYVDITQGQTGKLFYRAEDEDGYVQDVCLYNSEKDTHDSAAVLLNYGGAARAVYTECFHSALTGRRLRIIGDQAELLADEAAMRLEVSYRHRNERVAHTFVAGGQGHGGGDEGQIAALLDAIRGGAPTRATGEAGMWAVAVGQAAELARRSGRIVALDEVLEP